MSRQELKVLLGQLARTGRVLAASSGAGGTATAAGVSFTWSVILAGILTGAAAYGLGTAVMKSSYGEFVSDFWSDWIRSFSAESHDCRVLFHEYVSLDATSRWLEEQGAPVERIISEVALAIVRLKHYNGVCERDPQRRAHNERVLKALRERFRRLLKRL